MKIVEKKIEELIDYARNPRRNGDAVDTIAASLREFGWKQPVVIDRDGVIVAGHTRVRAAKKLGMTKVPCLIADDLTPEQIKAYRILDNKSNEKSQWDIELLLLELDELNIDWKAEFDITFPELGPAEPPPNVEFKEYDESVEKDVKYIECPSCGHQIPK